MSGRVKISEDLEASENVLANEIISVFSRHYEPVYLIARAGKFSVNSMASKYRDLIESI